MHDQTRNFVHCCYTRMQLWNELIFEIRILIFYLFVLFLDTLGMIQRKYPLLFNFKQRWFSGRILACHAGGPGSIPGRCNLLWLFATLNNCSRHLLNFAFWLKTGFSRNSEKKNRGLKNKPSITVNRGYFYRFDYLNEPSYENNAFLFL